MTKIKMLLNITNILIVTVAISACRSTVQNLPIPDSEIVPKEKARIILTIEPQFAGSHQISTIKDNGVLVGYIANNDGKLIWDRPEGKSCLTGHNMLGKRKSCYYAKKGLITNISYNFTEGFSLNSFDSSIKDINVIDIND